MTKDTCQDVIHQFVMAATHGVLNQRASVRFSLIVSEVNLCSRQKQPVRQIVCRSSDNFVLPVYIYLAEV